MKQTFSLQESMGFRDEKIVRRPSKMCKWNFESKFLKKILIYILWTYDDLLCITAGKYTEDIYIYILKQIRYEYCEIFWKVYYWHFDNINYNINII